MTARIAGPSSRRARRLLPTAIAAAALALGPAAVAGCSSSDGATTCNLNGCTVTLDRGVDAQVSVLGATVELVSVQGSLVTVKVGGQQVSIPLDAAATTSVAGLNVSVTSVDADKVVLQVAKA